MTPPIITRQQRIRAYLRAHHDGLTAGNLVVLTGSTDRTIKADLEDMPDAYIDRWVESPTRHKYEAIWCVVIPPPNCPKPEVRSKKPTSGEKICD